MTTYQIAGSVPAYVILCMPVSSLPCYASICLSAASWLSMLPSCCICLAVQPILHMHQAGACCFIASDTKYIIPVRVRLLPVCLSATKRKQVILQAKRCIPPPQGYCKFLQVYQCRAKNISSAPLISSASLVSSAPDILGPF